MQDAPWHKITTQITIEKLQSSTIGLSDAEAKARLKKYGLNRLPETPKRSEFFRFLLQFHNILIYVLIACAIVTALLNHWIDMGVILAVVIANAIIGFIQEGKAEKAMDAIQDMLTPHAHIIRAGQRISVKAECLVPGDIVLLGRVSKVASAATCN
ncbi:MAG: cation-transporting P-type ATPase [Gammaproteobacteria bacterium]